MVIFTTLLPTGEHCPENAVSRLFGGASSWVVSLSAVCGGPTTDDLRLTIASFLAGGRRAGPIISALAPIPKAWELMSASTRGPAPALQRSALGSCACDDSCYSELPLLSVSARHQAGPRDHIVTRNAPAHAVKDPETDRASAVPTHHNVAASERPITCRPTFPDICSPFTRGNAVQHMLGTPRTYGGAAVASSWPRFLWWALGPRVKTPSPWARKPLRISDRAAPAAQPTSVCDADTAVKVMYIAEMPPSQ
jgi:hypothetical protein